MIRRANILDSNFLSSLWKHPEIAPFILDDYAQKESHLDWKILLNTPLVYFLIPENGKVSMGCFFIHPWNSICFEIHSLILPEFRGKMLIPIVKEGIEWMERNTGCRKLLTQVPEFNRKAYAFAVRSGFKIEGKNEGSFLHGGKIYDQYLFGLKLEG